MRSDPSAGIRSRLSRLYAVALLVPALAVGPVAYGAATVTSMPDASGASALSLVNALLGSSPGLSVVAGSAQYTGQASASGTFTNGGTTAAGLGIDRGVVLTSGDARFIGSSALFPGDESNKSGTFTAGVVNALTVNTSGGNALLNGLTSNGTTNASVLSFQIVPTVSALTLTFVFGSEDYNDLVNAGFPNDVFGIFVNGINYAKVGGAAISAATINCGGPTPGPAPGSGPNCALYRDNAPLSGAIDTELDGLTAVLSIVIPLNVGVVNSIAIGIADAFDVAGDSALLIRAGTVAAIPEPATAALLAIACAALAMSTKRRRRSGGAGTAPPMPRASRTTGRRP